MPNTTTCAHRACQCTAPHGENYCGPYCRNASDLTEVTCGCGHRGCVEEVMKQQLPRILQSEAEKKLM